MFFFLFLALKSGNKLSCLLFWRTLLINIWFVCYGVKPKSTAECAPSPAQAIHVRWLDPSLTCLSSCLHLAYQPAHSCCHTWVILFPMWPEGVWGLPSRRCSTTLNLNLWLKQCAPLETAHYFIFPEAWGTLASPRLLRVQAPQDQNIIQDWKWWKRSLIYSEEIKRTCVWN